MIDPELLRFLKIEIKKQLNIILSGTSGTNTIEYEDIKELYPAMPTIKQRPIMHPFGLVSRAPNGTVQVTARQGDHVGNRIVLGHRDADRPDLKEGETIIYDQFGHIIYLSKNKMQFGSKDSAENMVLGPKLQAYLTKLVNAAFKPHKHIGNLGYLTAPPDTASTAASDLASDVTGNVIISDKCFTEK